MTWIRVWMADPLVLHNFSRLWSVVLWTQGWQNHTHAHTNTIPEHQKGSTLQRQTGFSFKYCVMGEIMPYLLLPNIFVRHNKAKQLLVEASSLLTLCPGFLLQTDRWWTGFSDLLHSTEKDHDFFSAFLWLNCSHGVYWNTQRVFTKPQT